MAIKFTSLNQLLEHGADDVIDVRSPAEFAEDHFPGAINLPVLSNDERAEVGTIYVQDSPFKARKLGAAMVFRNAANHIAGPLADRPGNWKPLVYCWRGGQRSGSFGWMLGQIGWQSEVIEGGYQTFRRLVHQAMYTTPIAQKIVLLDGNTGTAKTDIIQELKKIDVQTIDLEGLAGHRGSLLGEMPGGQPSQKAFESRIALSLAQMDPNRPVIVEAESNKIGARIIPPTLWDAMKAAPRIGISASIETRTTYLTRAYDDILSDQERLRDRLSPLIAHRGHELVNGWYTLLNSGDKFGLTKALMEQHYDPSYAKSRNAIGAHFIAEISVEKLDQAGISDAAIAVKSAISKLSSS